MVFMLFFKIPSWNLKILFLNDFLHIYRLLIPFQKSFKFFFEYILKSRFSCFQICFSIVTLQNLHLASLLSPRIGGDTKLCLEFTLISFGLVTIHEKYSSSLPPQKSENLRNIVNLKKAKSAR